jgi:hypothetical protein
MTPSNNETVSELLTCNETLTQTLNRFLKQNFNETLVENSYITSLAIAQKERRLFVNQQIQVIAVSMGLGLVLHLVCRELVKRNPEFFKEDLENPEKKVQVRNTLREILQRLRGGSLFEVTVLKRVVLNISMGAGGGIAIGVGGAGTVIWWLTLPREKKSLF